MHGLWIVGITAGLFTLLGVVATRKRYPSLISARNTLSSWLVTSTVFASVMGGWILVTPADSLLQFGLPALIGYAVGSGLAPIIVAWIGTRIRQRYPNGIGLTDVIQQRYGRVMQLTVGLISLFYMAIFLAAELTAISKIASELLDLPYTWVIPTIVGSGVLIYTALGGLRATIVTDAVQAIILLPLLAILVGVGIQALSGLDLSEARTSITEVPPLALTSSTAWWFGLSLVILLVGANLFHQGFWQRVYAAKSDQSMRRAFAAAGILMVPVILIVGLAGLSALSVSNPDSSSALFVAIKSTPLWLKVSVLVVAIALIMSSADTLINGMVSIILVQTAGPACENPDRRLTAVARMTTVIFGVAATVVAFQNFNVLELFILADVICVAAVVPTFLGLFSRRIRGWVAAVALAAGVIPAVIWYVQIAPAALGPAIVALAVPTVILAIEYAVQAPKTRELKA